MSSIFRYLLILIAAALVAAVNVWINPNRPPWSESVLLEGEIRISDAVGAEGSVLWLDARSASDYAVRHVPGALPLNEDDWDTMLGEVLSAWEPEQITVVYCGSQQCQASHSVAERLRNEVGLDEVYVLKGGWEAWLEHKN